MSSVSVASEIHTYKAALKSIRLPKFARRNPARPYVVAIEGANGVGKTTLCRALARQLHVPSRLGTDQAWFSDQFKVRMIRDADWFASAMFFLSGCFEQMRRLQGLRTPLVIMDRGLWSTLAVQGTESPVRLRALATMLNTVAAEIQVPDLTLVLDASFVTCQSRIARKEKTDRALDELTATASFHAREKEFYRWLARQTRSLVWLDVDRANAKQVASAALALIRQRMPC